MRLALLLSVLLFFSLTLQGQTLTAKVVPTSHRTSVKKELKVFPNPAINFIQLKESSKVGAIIIYNLVGRKIKNFTPVKDKAYQITDLPKGMYLIQLLDFSGKVLSTQRLSKK